jgi:putative hydrolase of the HAD superfamily
MSRIEAVISDFGGVLTAPLLDSFRVYEEVSGIPLAELGKAMAAVGEDHGANPLFELETGRITEAQFLDSVAGQLSRQLGREVTMAGFGELYFEHLHPNETVIAYMRELKRRGYKLAICTNNVREWEPLWRAKLPVDEIFLDVVDSGFVGIRKPDPEIYEMTLERLGIPAEAALLLDDIELNCTAARELGMSAVWFRSTEQAIADVEAALAAS